MLGSWQDVELYSGGHSHSSIPPAISRPEATAAVSMLTSFSLQQQNKICSSTYASRPNLGPIDNNAASEEKKK